MNENSPSIPESVGQLFSRLYVDRSPPVSDNPLFRNRLGAYVTNNFADDRSELADYLKEEGGLVVPWNGRPQFSSFFTDAPIHHVLNAITLIWRYMKKYSMSQRGAPGQLVYYKSNHWYQFVSRALREENMGYRLDERCGVHFFVDEEFERNRVSALSCLESQRYAGVRTAFEAAHAHLDSQPVDTKASVRAAFEALEVLARLMVPDSKNLNKWMVENKLKPLALAKATDTIEQDTFSKLFDGLGDVVDSLHNYRHGQGMEQPVAPSLTLAVYVVSTVATTLRLLATISEQ